MRRRRWGPASPQGQHRSCERGAAHPQPAVVGSGVWSWRSCQTDFPYRRFITIMYRPPMTHSQKWRGWRRDRRVGGVPLWYSVRNKLDKGILVGVASQSSNVNGGANAPQSSGIAEVGWPARDRKCSKIRLGNFLEGSTSVRLTRKFGRCGPDEWCCWMHESPVRKGRRWVLTLDPRLWVTSGYVDWPCTNGGEKFQGDRR